jgi:hypothetical protein
VVIAGLAPSVFGAAIRSLVRPPQRYIVAAAAQEKRPEKAILLAAVEIVAAQH